MSLSKKDRDELKPMLDRALQKTIGFSDSTLVIAAVNCLDKGYDRKKTIDKLGSFLDDTQATKFVDKLFDVYKEFNSMSRHDRSRKRKEKEEKEETLEREKKKKRFEESATPVVPEPGNPSPGQLTADKIKDMMATAQRQILERKAQLTTVGSSAPEVPSSASVPPTVLGLPSQHEFMSEAIEKVRKAAELQARIQATLHSTGLGAAIMPLPPFQGQANGEKPAQSTGPTPLILDEQGRTIDAKTGQTVQLSHHMPTLKANIRAKKREQFKAVIQEKAPEDISESHFFDPRVAAKTAQRPKRGFRFFEQGKFEQLASRLRTKAQLEKLQNEIATAAKKTGIASAAKLATLQPKRNLKEGEVPDIEWWDFAILRTDSYEHMTKTGPDDAIEFHGVTSLVEHPITMRPPAEPTKDVEIAVMLTKRERKKLRRQNRNETQKELQEKIRLGLMPPPEPKVRMANLMRVLGTEAVQDPTKVEAHVRAQMAKRVKAHEEANAARKLSKDERRDKKINKLKEDSSLGVHVTLYRVRDLSNPALKFKVETNANQLYMTGLVVLRRDCNVVVVEGGPKQQKKFKRLMLHRIKWEEDQKSSSNKDRDDDGEERKPNYCSLVWEGMVKSRSFGEIKFKMCPTENFAREQFKKHDVEHYWDLAYSGSVLEAAGEDS